MDIQEQKINLIRWITELEDKELLARLLKLCNKANSKNKSRISKSQYNKELDEAEQRIESNEYYTHEDAKQHIQQWKEK